MSSALSPGGVIILNRSTLAPPGPGTLLPLGAVVVVVNVRPENPQLEEVSPRVLDSRRAVWGGCWGVVGGRVSAPRQCYPLLSSALGPSEVTVLINSALSHQTSPPLLSVRVESPLSETLLSESLFSENSLIGSALSHLERYPLLSARVE